MESNRGLVKTTLLSTCLAAAGIAGALLFYMKWPGRRKKPEVEPSCIKLVCKPGHWDKIYPRLKQDIEHVKVVGLDCEWLALHRGVRPVSLLQLATPSGLCVLVRLQHFDNQIPQTLKDLLADRSILKVGVECLGDARKLEKDYGLKVQGCVDLRFIAMRTRLQNCGTMGLKSLCQAALSYDMDKNPVIRSSNWEIYHLSNEQIRYAAMDALVGVLIFLQLACRKLGVSGLDDFLNSPNLCSKMVSMCQGIVDVHFRYNMQSSRSARGSRHSPAGPERPATRAYQGRRTPLYHNCQLRAPDGQLLCTCDHKKAEWYMEKGLGEKISDDPFSVQLNFEPSGRPLDETNYYLQDKLNLCVVCGNDESYLRKNVVPQEYRKNFPPVMKNHRSHDIVLMCSACHQLSACHDANLRQQLEVRCDAPMSRENGRKFVADPELQRVKSAAKALLKSRPQLPEWREKELFQVVRNYYGVEDIDDDLLQRTQQIDTKIANDSFTAHGRKVVEHYTEHDGLVAFERMWRQHFLDTMQPKHLPLLWSVNHSHHELASMDEDIKQLFAAGASHIVQSSSRSDASEHAKAQN